MGKSTSETLKTTGFVAILTAWVVLIYLMGGSPPNEKRRLADELGKIRAEKNATDEKCRALEQDLISCLVRLLNKPVAEIRNELPSLRANIRNEFGVGRLNLQPLLNQLIDRLLEDLRPRRQELAQLVEFVNSSDLPVVAEYRNSELGKQLALKEAILGDVITSLEELRKREGGVEEAARLAELFRILMETD